MSVFPAPGPGGRRGTLARAAALAGVLAGAVPPITAHADGAITFTDQRDRKITLAKPAERVVTIPIPAASTFIAMDGSADRLVGMHFRSKWAIEDGILGRIFPAAKDIRDDIVGEGFMPNVEALLTTRPDLVFQWAHRGDDIINPMTNAGLTVATFLYGTEELSQGWMDIMGKVVGQPEKAQALIDWHEAKHKELKGLTDAIPEAERPRVLMFLRFLSEFRVAGDGTYNDFYIDLAGGRNAAKELDKFKVVNPEQIIAWDPEVILLTAHEHELTPQNVYDNPLFAGLSAVKNRRVYKVPLGGYRWDPPNQESPLMWMWLSMLFHPERFDWDLRGQMVEKYRFIYGHELTAAEIDSILKLELNKDQANYAQFAAR